MAMNTRAKVSYGIGAVGKDMVYAFVSGFVLYYYNDVLGINATFVGFLLMAARIFDAFNDPMMGVIVAKTNTRYGKYRPWIFLGTLLNALIMYAMYSVPNGLSGTGLLVYVSVTYVLWGLTYTFMDIPYWSMIPAITSTPDERESMSVIARSCAGFGYAIPSMLTMFLVGLIGNGDERRGFKILAIAVAAFFICALTITVMNVKEKVKTEVKACTVREMFRALFNNDQALIVVVTIIVFNASLYITQNLGTYFFKYQMHNASLYGIFGGVGGAAQILAMMALPALRKKFKRMDIFKGAVFAAIAGYALMFGLSTFLGNNLILLCVTAVIVFAGFGIETVLTTVFLADTVDYGELQSGHRNESVIFSLQTLVVKAASAIATFIAGIGIDVIGLDREADVQASGTLLGMRIIMMLIPIIGLVFTFVFFKKKFNLSEEKMEAINKELESKRGN